MFVSGWVRRAAAVTRAPLVFGICALGLGGGAASGALARDIVPIAPSVAPGTIVINAHQRRLYLVVSEGRAISYPVAVPKAGKEWSGYAAIDGKYVNPDWVPPAVVKADHPELPNFIRGGSPHNPMGVRALTLDRNQVAIHGTTARMRASVGTAASYGCIRMLNEDVVDLFDRVSVGSPVLMMP